MGGFNQFFEQIKDMEPEQQIKRFRFVSADEICRNQKPVAWLIKNFFSENDFGVIFGESGSGKSFIGIDLGLSVAANKDWHGHPVKSGSVIYIAGEGHIGINKRIKAWAQHYGISLSNVPFFVSDRPAQFLNEESAAEVCQSVDEIAVQHGSPVLIIIDTLARNFGDGDENSTRDMSRFVSIIDENLRLKYQCAVLLIHHTGKSATDKARGAYALKAALDTEYRLDKNVNGQRILTCTKMKDYEAQPPLAFALKQLILEDWFDEDGSPLTSCVLKFVEGTILAEQKLTGANKIAYDALAQFPGGAANAEGWWLASLKNGISTSTKLNSQKKAFHRAVSDLRDDGLVIFKDDFYYIKNRNGTGGT